MNAARKRKHQQTDCPSHHSGDSDDSMSVDESAASGLDEDEKFDEASAIAAASKRQKCDMIYDDSSFSRDDQKERKQDDIRVTSDTVLELSNAMKDAADHMAAFATFMAVVAKSEAKMQHFSSSSLDRAQLEAYRENLARTSRCLFDTMANVRHSEHLLTQLANAAATKVAFASHPPQSVSL